MNICYLGDPTQWHVQKITFCWKESFSGYSPQLTILATYGGHLGYTTDAWTPTPRGLCDGFRYSPNFFLTPPGDCTVQLGCMVCLATIGPGTRQPSSRQISQVNKKLAGSRLPRMIAKSCILGELRSRSQKSFSLEINKDSLPNKCAFNCLSLCGHN